MKFLLILSFYIHGHSIGRDNFQVAALDVPVIFMLPATYCELVKMDLGEPEHIVARYISLAEFFTHVSSLFMAIWVLGAFVKICVFFYVTVLGAAQWMNLSDYRPIVFPIGLLLVLFSIWVAPNYQELTHAISMSVTLSTLTMFVYVPVVLICFAWVKNMIRKGTA